jgi:iron(III) transport system substrate-binding protein
LGVLVAALALGGCGSPSSQSGSGRKTSDQLTRDAAAVKGLDPSARERKLLELARKEGGELSFYTTLNPRVLAPLTKKFEDRYGVHVAAFTTEAAGLLQRVSQESKAGRKAVDVIDTGGPELSQMAKDGVLADYSSPGQSRLGPDAVQDGWTTDRYTQFVVAWNTKRVRPGQQPKSWEELADPRWKGRLSLSPTTTGVSLYQGLGDYWIKNEGKSQAEVDRIFKGIARNSTIVAQTAVNAEQLAAGEFDVAVGSVATNNIEALRRAGSPVAWKPPVEPIVRQRQGTGLVRDARHPAAAMLFMDYLIGDGQEVFAADFRDPARVDLSSTGGAKTTLVDLDALAAQQAELTKRWDRVVGLGKEASPGG